jgi:hypothetical protein
MTRNWLARMSLVVLCTGSGWSTAASAQNPGAENNRLVLAVVVRRIFDEGNLALADDFVAEDVTNNGAPLGRDGFKALVRDLRAVAPDLALTVDDVAIQGGRVIGYVTQRGGAASERRIIALTIDDGLVREYRSWAGVALRSTASAH